jgi:hypothetical protein
MTTSDVLAILTDIHAGIDPISQVSLPQSSPYRHPRVVRALREVLLSLRQQWRAGEVRVLGPVVRLSDFAKVFVEVSQKGSRGYLDPATGESLVVTTDVHCRAEVGNDEGLQDWEREYFARVRAAISGWLPIWGDGSIEPSGLRSEFADEAKPDWGRDALLAAVRSSRPAAFNEALDNYFSRDIWLSFCEDRRKDAARAWLDEHGISYRE